MKGRAHRAGFFQRKMFCGFAFYPSRRKCHYLEVQRWIMKKHYYLLVLGYLKSYL